jgi:transcriptional regulator with XRE-family HTH domain
MQEANTFGKRLAAARDKAKLTQDDLSRGMRPDGGDLSKGAVSAWEQDRAQPSAEQLRKICERLDTTAEALWGVKAAA